MPTNGASAQACLFGAWLEVMDASGLTRGAVLAQINEACGTRYTHSWISRMRSDPSRRGERMPLEVRLFMLKTVLASELCRHQIMLPTREVEKLAQRLC